MNDQVQAAVSVVVLGGIGFFVYKLFIAPKFSPLSKIPGPKPTSWIMGNYAEIAKANPTDQHLKWAEQYGDVCLYTFAFGSRTVLVSGANEIKHVLINNSNNYLKQVVGQDALINDILGEGLLFLEGETHRLHRKMIQPGFNYGQLKQMIPLFIKKTQKLVDRWNKLRADGESTMDISTEMSNLTLDIIGRSSFAYEMNAVDDPDGKMSNWCKTVMDTFHLTFWILLPGYRKLPTPANLKLKESIREVESVIMKTIKEKQAKMVNGEKSDLIDLLDLLLETKDDNGVLFTDHQILNHAMTFMLAGHETTSAGLSWLFYLLSQHPEVEAKLAEEVKVFKGRTDFTIEELEKLPYLENVIKETLRLYPPAPITIRIAINDDNIGGYHIPAGSKVLISSGVVHRLEKYWGPTAKSFNPDRWDDPKIKELPHHLYFPFLLGPRSCIGAKFARLEMKVIIVMLMNHFSLKLVPGSFIRPQLTLTQKPHPSLPMTVHARS